MNDDFLRLFHERAEQLFRQSLGSRPYAIRVHGRWFDENQAAITWADESTTAQAVAFGMLPCDGATRDLWTHDGTIIQHWGYTTVPVELGTNLAPTTLKTQPRKPTMNTICLDLSPAEAAELRDLALLVQGTIGRDEGLLAKLRQALGEASAAPEEPPPDVLASQAAELLDCRPTAESVLAAIEQVLEQREDAKSAAERAEGEALLAMRWRNLAEEQMRSTQVRLNQIATKYGEPPF